MSNKRSSAATTQMAAGTIPNCRRKIGIQHEQQIRNYITILNKRRRKKQTKGYANLTFKTQGTIKFMVEQGIE